MATQIKTTDFDPAAMLCRDCVRVDIRANSMVDLMQAMAEPLARATGIDQDFIAEALVQRERVGTTAFGGGTAVPHARMPHLTRVVGAFATLDPPLELGALDGEPVAVVYALLSPQSAGADHLK
ncbi:MAG: PTS sugar transporter subunit IIA, partial [Pacificimonas sp.]